jgi:pyruvate dehydrogenase E2 component (dihydrolipoamide acetyltransferase)
MDLLSMPRLGQTMDVGVIVARHVDVGAPFAAGDVLYTVETEKVETEVEAKTDGRLLRWLASDGDEIAVGSPVAVLAHAGDPTDDASVDRFLAGDDPIASTDTPGVVSDELRASPPTVSTVSSGRVRAVPKARSIAREHGVDLADVAASGEGPITVPDIEAHLARRAAAPPARPNPAAAPMVAPLPAAPASGPEPVRLDGNRRAMVSSMTTSWSTIPHFTEMIEVDASSLLRERAEFDGPGKAPTVTAYLIREFAAACRAVPILHAGLVDGGMIERDQVDMAVAVDTDQGLVAPVMRGADRLDVVEIGDRLRGLAERARSRRLQIADVEGGHVALSNLGAFGVQAGTPIIPPRQTAMLFAGSVVERPVVLAGEIVIRPMMWLSLTCDHRLIDGATAARALQALRTSVEGSEG